MPVKCDSLLLMMLLVEGDSCVDYWTVVVCWCEERRKKLRNILY